MLAGKATFTLTRATARAGGDSIGSILSSTRRMATDATSRIGHFMRCFGSGVPGLVTFKLGIVFTVMFCLVKSGIVSIVHGIMNGSVRESGTSIKIHRFISSVLGFKLCTLLVFVVTAGFNIRSSSMTTVVTSTNITVNLTLRKDLSGFTKNVLVLLLEPFTIKSCVVIGSRKVRKAMGMVRVFCAGVAAVSGGAVIIPGDVLADGDLAGMATEPRHRLSLGMKVSCRSSLGGTGRVMRGLLLGSRSIVRSRRVGIFVSRLTSDDIIVKLET